jgi:hypothetical protein
VFFFFLVGKESEKDGFLAFLYFFGSPLSPLSCVCVCNHLFICIIFCGLKAKQIIGFQE